MLDGEKNKLQNSERKKYEFWAADFKLRELWK